MWLSLHIPLWLRTVYCKTELSRAARAVVRRAGPSEASPFRRMGCTLKVHNIMQTSCWTIRQIKIPEPGAFHYFTKSLCVCTWRLKIQRIVIKPPSSIRLSRALNGTPCRDSANISKHCFGFIPRARLAHSLIPPMEWEPPTPTPEI